MAKGALAGVLVLGGIVVGMLFAVAGTGLYWLHRSRQLGGTYGVQVE